MKNQRISASQLLLLLLLARLMHTMIFRFDEFTSGTPLMLGLIITTAVECVLAIPAVVYYETGGKSAVGELPCPRAWASLYSAYFAVIAGSTVALFAEFLASEFSGCVSPTAAIVLLSAAAAYCAYMGIEGLARAGTAVFWLFAGMFLLMVLVSEGEFNPLNIRPLTGGDVGAILKYAADSCSSAWQIPMLAILGENLEKGAFKAAYGFLLLKFTVIGSLLVLVTLVLWRYIDVLGYPIYALGAYAKSDFIKRFDAINMLVWAMNCVLCVGVYIYISSKPVGKRLHGAAFFGLAAAAFGIFEYKRGLRLDETWFMIFKLSGVIILGAALPTASLLVKAAKRKKEVFA